MRKICVIVLSFVLAFSAFLPMSVTAASNTYDISAWRTKVEVAIPEGYDVITRDTPSGDPIFRKLGTTSSVVFDEFERYDIYLKARSSDNIVVTMSERVLDHFDLLSDTTLPGRIAQLEGWYAKYGLKIVDYRLCHNAQLQFLEIYFTDPVRNISALQYYTVYNGRSVSFILYSNSVRLNEKQENTLKAVVNNSRISNAPTYTDPDADTEAFQYTDTDSRVSFTVPKNWKQVGFAQEKELADVQFVSTKDAECTMVFGGTDIWGKMSASDTIGHTREDLNSSKFTMADIADFFGISADKVSMVTYNGAQYFQFETDYPLDIYGDGIWRHVTQLVHIDSGWMYMFQFSGTSTHKRYSDFEKLLNSVNYPAVSEAEATDPSKPATSVPDPSKQDSLKSDLYNAAAIVFVVLLLLLIATVIVIAVATIPKKRNEILPKLEHSPTYHAPETKPISNAEKTVVCKKCGEKLIENRRFCTRCGTEMIEAKNGSEYEQHDVLRTETEEIAMFCQKCGQKLSPENNLQCSFCGTVVEHPSEVDTPAPKTGREEPAQQETKPKKKSVKKIVRIASLSLVFLAGIGCAALFFMGPKVILQDINAINGCPEFYNLKFGMTVDQASNWIKMKHKAIKGLESSSYYEVDDFMKDSHILIDESEVFSLYGIEAEDVYVAFDEKYVNAVMFAFNKEEVSHKEIVDLYVKIYGPATTQTSSTATWVGTKTTIEVYDYESSSNDREKTIVVRYSITDNSQYTTLSFDGPELDPCDFLGKNNAFNKKPSYYINGLKKDNDYSYEKFSAAGFANFEKYTLYPKFEYMGIDKGYTAITFDKDGSEDTIGVVSYLFLLDSSNAVDRMSYIEKALTQEYGACISCTYTSTKYSELGILDITFDELKQKVGSNTQGIYHVQWESNGRKITLGLTISVDKSYYDGSVSYTD